jgi:hypothetical protein
MRSLALALILGLAATPALAAPKAAPAAPAPSQAPAVEPRALDALQRMSSYVASLPAFEVTSDTSLDLVKADGQKVSMDGEAHYKVRRPNAFVIDVNTDFKKRRFIYDGKQITVYAPEKGYYATVAAPATTREVLDTLWTKYGIALPLEDLFRWNDPAGARHGPMTSAFAVREEAIDGVATEQYAFREGDLDWQVWIQKGDQPLPRKVIIVDRTDPALPAYQAHLTWNVNPSFGADDFTFRPGPGAQQIALGQANR